MRADRDARPVTLRGGGFRVRIFDELISGS